MGGYTEEYTEWLQDKVATTEKFQTSDKQNDILPLVSQQRELLKAFKEWEKWDYKKPYDTPIDEIIDDYISLL